MGMTEPKPCFVCGRKPIVDSFLLMDLQHRGWTALCPGKCYETNTYYDKEDAIADWNRWVESEGYVEELDEVDDDWTYWEGWNER